MNIENMVPKIIRAGFESDYNSLESFALLLSRKYKKKFPDISDEIANILVHKNIGNTSYRSIGMQSLPVDEGTRFELATIEEPIENMEGPILDEDMKERLDRFILERFKSEKLLKHGVRPSNSIILYGDPGVGKTYSAKWLASKLDMTLITLDLAATVSSYLGKTGQNLKSILDYAKSCNSVLFLDEFDAIAKRRDDQSDVGELKRIVNVLLKELENWPVNCVVIAATNHPQLLDKAIWRRFDLKLNIPMPDNNLRFNILRRELEDFSEVNDDFIRLIAELTEGVNASDLCRLCEAAKRRYILDDDLEFSNVIFSELRNYNMHLKTKNKEELCKKIKKVNPNIDIDTIVQMTGFSKSSVYRYLK